jgi:hypothetical protein
MEAKREETRERRLAELIARSAKREPIKLLDRRPPAQMCAIFGCDPPPDF